MKTVADFISAVTASFCIMVLSGKTDFASRTITDFGSE